MSESVEKTNKAGQEVTLFVPNKNQLDQLDKMQEDFSLNAKYKGQEDWPLLKDKPLRAFFMGLKEIPGDDGELLMAGVFVSKTEIFLSAQSVLVDAVRNLNPETPVEITYRGKKANKSNEGSTMIFDVSKLA